MSATPPNVAVETITPELAREYLTHNTSNRNLRKRLVAGYAADMAAGDWEWNGESIKFAADGTLLDGQHRLAAIIEAGVTVPILVVRGLPGTTQDTMDTGARRSLADVLRLRGEPHYVALAATLRGVTAFSQGVTVARGGRAYSNRECLRTLEEYPWIRDGLPTIRRAAALAHLPATVAGPLWWAFTLLDPEDAEHFFARLMSDEGHRSGDPISILRRLLIQSTQGVRGARNERYLMAVTIKAWNKYRDGDECAQIRYRMGGANPETFPVAK